MAIWFQIAVTLNVIYWVVFFYLLSRRRWTAAALAVGIFHMLFASIVSVAPIRSLLDPDYVGYGLGVLHFEKSAVAIPAALILAWALAAACVSVAKGRGLWMKLVMVGDLFFALSLVISILLDGPHNWKFQLGEHFTATGVVGLLVLLMIFALPFIVSAVWAAQRSRAAGTNPPSLSDARESGGNIEDNDKTTDGFRLLSVR